MNRHQRIYELLLKGVAEVLKDAERDRRKEPDKPVKERLADENDKLTDVGIFGLADILYDAGVDFCKHAENIRDYIGKNVVIILSSGYGVVGKLVKYGGDKDLYQVIPTSETGIPMLFYVDEIKDIGVYANEG